MTPEELQFLRGQFEQFRRDIKDLIQNEVRKIVSEQRKICMQQIEKKGKNDRVLNMFGGFVGGVVFWASYWVAKWFKK